MKKGSLSLSMNAIVILILAITLLGLGLSFMRGLFGTMTTKVQEAVSAQELVNPPTTDNQLTVAPAQLDLAVGTSGKVLLAYLNNNPSATTTPDSCGLQQMPACQAAATAGACASNMPGVIASIDQVAMRKGQINTWTVAISSPDSGTFSDAACTYLCTAKLACSTGSTQGEWQKDFIITYTR